MPSALPRRPGRAVVLPALVALVAAGACGGGGDEARDGLEPDTARFTYGERSVEVELTACGREDDVVLAAGAAGGSVVQARGDLGEGGTARSGVTADVSGDGIFGAFGAEMDDGPAGEISDVRVDGDRLVIEGRWTTFDGDLVPEPTAGEPLEGRFVARCPEPEDETAGAPR